MNLGRFANWVGVLMNRLASVNSSGGGSDPVGDQIVTDTGIFFVTDTGIFMIIAEAAPSDDHLITADSDTFATAGGDQLTYA